MLNVELAPVAALKIASVPNKITANTEIITRRIIAICVVVSSI